MGVRWRRGLSAAVAAVVAVGVIGVPAPERVVAAGRQCVDVAGSEVEARVLAASCGQPVVVDGSRTEFAEVTALPDGRLQFASAVVPQRTRKAGSWRDIDLNLARGGDGLWRPGVSVADVAFSGGGDGAMVTLTRGGRTVTLSWPGTLPAPTVSGDALTYADVLADVDLVVRATRTGFTHVLVVKTRAAATHPDVREPRFRIGGDVEVVAGPDGGLRAMAGGAVVASAEPAVMWDSRVGAVDGVSARGSLTESSPSTATVAGDAARTGKVDVEVSGDHLVLRPDETLLDHPDAVFPLFVDPAWSVFKSKWAYGTNNGSSNSDTSRARVGLNPDTGALYRSYFAFSTTANGVSLKGKHIESAYVQMKLDHSWSCGPTVSAMYLTSAINATPKATWSSMKMRAFLNSATGNANEAGGCSSIQPDMIMNFKGSNTTSQVQAAATGNWSSITVAFTARAADGSGESTEDRWKKFFPNDAKLIVDYDTKPGAPHTLQAAGVTCGSGVLTIGTLAPTFSAVFPDADSSDSLTGTFEWIEVPAGGIGTVTSTFPARKSPPPARTGITPNSRATSSAVTVAKGPTYAFRARGTDKAPYSITGSWSSWCQFTPDTTVPPVPTITPGTAGGPGKTMTFSISTTTTDVTKFRFGWSNPPTTEVAASGANPKTATVTVTVPSFGQNTLWVRGIDATGNLGNIGSATFTAPRPSPAVAQWGLEQYPGVDQTVALADQQPTLGGQTDLSASNVSWVDDVRLNGGKTAGLNGSSSVLTTSGSVVNTANSFSIATWVRLTSLPTTGDVVIASQAGASAAGFHLGTRLVGSPLTPRWSFLMKDSDDQSSTTRVAYSATALTSADVGRWTHIAGVYDKAAGKVRLYVDGELVAEVDRSGTPWNATGTFAVGRGWSSGVASNWFHGTVADVQAYDRVLVPQDFVGQLAQDPASGGFHEPGMLTPVRVGDWNFEFAVPSYLADLRDTCEAPSAVTTWDRWLALTRGSAVGAGYSTDGSGLWLDDEYFPEEGFTESTAEYGRSAVKAGTTPPDADGLEFTQWQDKPVLRTDQSFTMSAWVMLDRLDGMRTAVSQRGQHASGGWLKFNSTLGKWQFAISDEDTTTTPTASITSTSTAEEGVWTHLVGVYDAGRKQIRLYVNGELEGVTQNISFTPMVSTGPLLVGRVQWQGQLKDPWIGGIDNVAVFQGALTDTAVYMLYDS
ncbi:LamG-like jellyroll fold domain-containing protein [Verrucosispora sp. WMMD573]|uniref:LamG-like jellyroll fold domain-containing protein n=1 Tax=Verrucosispora sp. WMMD573 TaxID=3015149 RepID=UPI00248B3C85|nr:LamG-like jellyroll fold domain-containing protein [Verrucosispora sp. WMMD573]WBB52450.1 LamG domain-containing protein [Verrucosispora sp. WMMD573]